MKQTWLRNWSVWSRLLNFLWIIWPAVLALCDSVYRKESLHWSFPFKGNGISVWGTNINRLDAPRSLATYADVGYRRPLYPMKAASQNNAWAKSARTDLWGLLHYTHSQVQSTSVRIPSRRRLLMAGCKKNLQDRAPMKQACVGWWEQTHCLPLSIALHGFP